MKYLFVDRWADYSFITDNYRENPISPLILLYATALRKFNEDVYFIDASDKCFSKNELFHFVDKEQVDTIVFYANVDNISSILRLDIKNRYKNTNIILLSINEDLSALIKDKSIINIIVNEENSIGFNLNIFLKKCNLNIDIQQLEEIQIDYSFQNNIQEKSILINIGSGCKGSCKFCSISGSELSYRNIDVIIEEIKSLLSRGIKFFHVINHNFTCDRNFVEDFCTKLIDIGNQYDFAWSCFVIPGFFVNNLDLLPLMVKAKIKKIEIGCESGSNDLLRELGINHTQSDLEKIINSAIVARVPILAFHFVIGTPSESSTSLNETKDFISRLIFLTTSLCDIYLHCYYPEKEHCLNIFDNIVKKRTNFLFGTNTLNINDLITFMKDARNEIKLKKNELFIKVPIKFQYEQFELAHKYNVISQIQNDFISKSYKQVVFTNKVIFGNSRFSWEIEDELDEYTPIFFGNIYIPGEELKKDHSNLNIVLSNYVRNGSTVKEIVEMVTKQTNGMVDRHTILSIFNEWENILKIYYLKYLQ